MTSAIRLRRLIVTGLVLSVLLIAGCSSTKTATIEQQRADFTVWYTAVMDVQNQADASMARYATVVADLNAGRMNLVEAYSVIKSIGNVQVQCSLKVDDPPIPTTLSATHQTALKDAAYELSLGMTARSMAIESLLKYIDDPKPGHMSEANMRLDSAGAHLVKALAAIAGVQTALGIAPTK